MGLRIIIADDHDIVRRGIRNLLEAHEGWTACGEATDGQQVVAMAEQLNPDIIVMDISMPNLNGLEAMRQILKRNPDQKIVVLTITDTEQVVQTVLEAGARGYILKTDAANDLVCAVEALEHDTTFFTPRVSQLVLEGFLKTKSSISAEMQHKSQLTSRERQIVQLIAEGKCSKEIATMLNLSVKTAETHRSNIMKKLSLHSTVELVLYAVRNNIVQVPSLTFIASSGT